MNSQSIEKHIDDCLAYSKKNMFSKPEKSLKKITEIEDLALSSKHKYLNVLRHKAMALQHLCNWDESLVVFFKLKSLHEKEKLRDRFYAGAMENIAMIYKELHKPHLSIKYFSKAVEIFSKLNFKEGETTANLKIGYLYWHSLEDYKNALKYFGKVINDAKENRLYLSEASGYAGIAGMLEQQEKCSEAIAYGLKVEEIIKVHSDGYLEMFLKNLYAGCYFKLKKLEQAIEFAKSAIKKAKNFKNRSVEMFNYVILLKSYSILEDEKNEQKYLTLLKKKSESLKSPADIIQFYKDVSEALKKYKYYEEAYKYLEQYYKTKEEVLSSEVQIKTARLKNEMDKLAAEKETEILRLRNLELKKEIELKRKEMNNAAVYLVRKNEFIENITSHLRNFITSENLSSYNNENILRELERISRKHTLNMELVHFEKNLNNMNIAFSEKLAKKFPRLTPLELKICSLMKINLSAKEIAKLLSISPRTIESHRYHIIQKLRLPKGKRLSSFISSF